MTSFKTTITSMAFGLCVLAAPALAHAQQAPAQPDLLLTPHAVAELTTIMDHIVTVDSQSWMMNRYDRGSMSNVQLLQRSADGQNGVTYGEYSFNGGRRGWVKARLENGQLSCVEFWDFAGRCRPIGQSYSRDIVEGLANAVVTSSMSGGGSSSGGDLRDCGSLPANVNPVLLGCKPTF